MNKYGTPVQHANSRHWEAVKSAKKHANFDILRLKHISECISKTLFDSHSYEGLAVCYENYSFESTNRAFSLGELGGVLKVAILNHTSDLTLVAPRQLKRFATGQGTADKEAVMTQALKEDNYFTQLTKKEFTDDLADAYFLAKMAWYQYNPEAAFKYENNRDDFRRRLEVCRKLKK